MKTTNSYKTAYGSVSLSKVKDIINRICERNSMDVFAFWRTQNAKKGSNVVRFKIVPVNEVCNRDKIFEAIAEEIPGSNPRMTPRGVYWNGILIDLQIA